MQSRCRLGLQASEGLLRMVESTFKLAHSQAVGGRPMDLSVGILECPQTMAASFPQSECFNRERLSPGSHTLSFLQYLICYAGQPIQCGRGLHIIMNARKQGSLELSWRLLPQEVVSATFTLNPENTPRYSFNLLSLSSWLKWNDSQGNLGPRCWR